MALKIIKMGMDTKQVVGRFKVDRQALAIMDHPHVARVLDGSWATVLRYGIGVQSICLQGKFQARSPSNESNIAIPICYAELTTIKGPD